MKLAVLGAVALAAALTFPHLVRRYPMRRIFAGLALALLVISPVAAGKPASVSISPSMVPSTEGFTITYDNCKAFRVTNPLGGFEDIDLPFTTGTSNYSGVSRYPFYAGAGTYTWECLWSNRAIATATLEVTP